MKYSNLKLKNLIFFFVFFFIIIPFIHAESLKLRVIQEDAVLRLKPSVESAVIYTLSLGTLLDSKGKTDGWYFVNLAPDKDGIVISGYIEQEYVEVLEMIKDVPEVKEEEVLDAQEPSMMPLPLAERHLRELAKRARSHRFSHGLENILYGVTFTGLGIAINAMAEEDEKDVKKLGTYCIAFGTVGACLGVWDFAVKSSVEKEYEEIMKLDPLEREATCAQALASEAHKGKIGRLISGAINTGLMLYFIIGQPIKYTGLWDLSDSFNWNYSFAAIGGIGAFFSFVGKSIEERHYLEYLNEKDLYERSSKIAFNFGFVRKGAAISISYTF
ncbi:MAG: hypothetical protein JXB26_13335 [Candidatus Aminicenantes bacterium]|nr:hypothetical protein [Candidatus Aminicenantes bacterium]